MMCRPKCRGMAMSSHENGLITVEREGDDQEFAKKLFYAMSNAVADIWEAMDEHRMSDMMGTNAVPPMLVRNPPKQIKGIVAAHTAIMPMLRAKHASLDLNASNKAERSVYILSGCRVPIVMDPKMQENSFRLVFEGDE